MRVAWANSSGALYFQKIDSAEWELARPFGSDFGSAFI